MDLSYKRAEDVPAVLTTKSGYRYERIRVRPYVRSDGVASAIVRWRGTCAECGEEFEVTSGLVCKAMNRRCAAHAKQGKPANAQAKAARNDALKRGRAAQRENRDEMRRLKREARKAKRLAELNYDPFA